MAARPSAAAYQPIPRQAFDAAAKCLGIRARQRDDAYLWVCAEQERGQTWWSVHHAVHAWTVHQMGRHSGRMRPDPPFRPAARAALDGAPEHVRAGAAGPGSSGGRGGGAAQARGHVSRPPPQPESHS